MYGGSNCGFENCSANLARVGAGDVALQLLNGMGLAGNHPLDQVADRDDAYERARPDRREDGGNGVASSAPCTRRRCVAVLTKNDRRGHDFVDLSFFGGVAHQDDFARVIALGDACRRAY